jgi:hypothetical protein
LYNCHEAIEFTITAGASAGRPIDLVTVSRSGQGAESLPSGFKHALKDFGAVTS